MNCLSPRQIAPWAIEFCLSLSLYLSIYLSIYLALSDRETISRVILPQKWVTPLPFDKIIESQIFDFALHTVCATACCATQCGVCSLACCCIDKTTTLAAFYKLAPGAGVIPAGLLQVALTAFPAWPQLAHTEPP